MRLLQKGYRNIQDVVAVLMRTQRYTKRNKEKRSEINTDLSGWSASETRLSSLSKPKPNDCFVIRSLMRIYLCVAFDLAAEMMQQ